MRIASLHFRAQNPQNVPFPLHDVDPHLIHQCLGRTHAPPQTAGRRFTHFRTLRRKVPIAYNGAPHIFPEKYPFPWADPQTQPPASSLAPSDLPPQTAYRSHQPFCHNPLDRQTKDDRQQTNRWLEGMFRNKGRYTLRFAA